MRVSEILAVSSFLLAIASAQQVLEGRQLHGDPGESRSQFFTETFNQSPSGFAPRPTFEGGWQLGLILGFVTTGCFMLYGVIVLIWDERNRHIEFKQRVLQDESKLMHTHNVQVQEMDQFRREFADREASLGKNLDEEERARLAEIN